MEAEVLTLLRNYQEYAIIISLSISIIVAILGLVPSFFITGANILFFGFWEGLAVSLLGETLGAIVAFTLYRKGFKKIAHDSLAKYPKLLKLTTLEGKQAFSMVLSLRLMPFIPSGLVTLAAAIGKISLLTFAISSSIGKIPALLIEGFSVYQIISVSYEVKLVLLLIGVLILFLSFRKSK